VEAIEVDADILAYEPPGLVLFFFLTSFFPLYV
jgi:hypothetical protein